MEFSILNFQISNTVAFKSTHSNFYRIIVLHIFGFALVFLMYSLNNAFVILITGNNILVYGGKCYT